MAIYPKIKPQTVGQVTNTKFSDLKNNDEFTKTIESIANPNIFLTEYPKTTPALAGKRFFYRNAEWHYMTKDEINAAGWTNLVSVGFPAPVDKYNLNKNIFFQNNNSSKRNIYNYDSNGALELISGSSTLDPNDTFTIDFLGLGDPTRISRISSSAVNLSLFPYNRKITKIINANLLTNLQDQGTLYTMTFVQNFTSASTIDDFLTQLPLTTKSATISIRVSDNPGTDAYNQAIATAKGYTIIK